MEQKNVSGFDLWVLDGTVSVVFEERVLKNVRHFKNDNFPLANFSSLLVRN